MGNLVAASDLPAVVPVLSQRRKPRHPRQGPRAATTDTVYCCRSADRISSRFQRPGV